MELILSWEPVTENISGSLLNRAPEYQVYRKKGDGLFEAIGEPVKGAKFIDTGLDNDMLYTYKVRPLVRYADTLQAGGDSREIAGVPRDIKPPAQPGHLVAVKLAEGVKLVWQAVLSKDLAGYRIYRRDENSAVPDLIGEVAYDQNQYVDQDLIDGRKWFYSVTSFDRQQPPNESLPSVEAAVEK
jgi:fibronectin type 3 domain-containing protein